MKQLTIQELKDKGLILLEAIVGSTSMGMNTPESDIDYNYIFMSPIEDLFGLNYRDQINEDKNDTTAYELGKFLRLLQTANPTVCSLLFLPDDCIIYKHPIMERLFEVRDRFIVKKMKFSFGAYASSQIKKADSLGKKMNWEKADMVRKNILDFVFTSHNQGSQLFIKWLKENGLKQEYCGLSSIPNMRYTYGVYYDYAQHLQREKIGYGTSEYYHIINNLKKTPKSLNEYYDWLDIEENFKYKGIVQNLETSNDVSLSSIPKDENPIAIVYVNLDGYQQHCKAFKEYSTWLKERNTQRYVDIDNHGQQIDGKNLSHCVRLLRMCKEIAEGKGIIVRRPDAEYLKSIRRGEVNLKDLLDECNEILENNDNLFDKSDLPESVDPDFVNKLLIDMRKEFY